MYTMIYIGHRHLSIRKISRKTNRRNVSHKFIIVHTLVKPIPTFVADNRSAIGLRTTICSYGMLGTTSLCNIALSRFTTRIYV